ncbi:piggyBac transposable element-derived protein 4-like [Anthonomus grandis grandis]|uniref:piggyBac transposable element-derived protein 4-like n=1 Tax=Anthonomus grandis grandis TaxID=2921223 RepID=UPI00216581C7|nr:piggyBac transposable element-derived protein 4-like [Anthonomus grandis grandis]
MLMTRNKKLTIKEFWSRDELLHSPIFGKKMSTDRYLQIQRYLHFCDNENASPNNRLYKVDHILLRIKERFQTQFRPFQDLSIDESLILFKGRLSFKQFIKSKRHRFGVKLFVLCDCETGIVLDFIVYLGKATSENLGPNEDLGISGAVVTKLMDQYLNKGHSLFTDNYYSSPALSTFLFKSNTNSCGTVRPHRKHMPKFTGKLNKGDVEWYSGANLLVIKWKDRRDVHMITTMHANEIEVLPKVDRITKENVRKPTCVVEYNNKMGAVDRTDMMISSIDSMRKSIKWYKKLYFHVMDVCLPNAHAMFLTTDARKIPLAAFQLEIIRQLFERLVIV